MFRFASPRRPRFNADMPARPQKITLAEMRASGDRWPDSARLSDLESLFVCQACGQRGADVRPDWHSAEAYA